VQLLAVLIHPEGSNVTAKHLAAFHWIILPFIKWLIRIKHSNLFTIQPTPANSKAVQVIIKIRAQLSNSLEFVIRII